MEKKVKDIFDEVKRASKALGNKASVTYIKNDEEIQIELYENNETVFRGFRIKKEGKITNITELYGGVVEYMKNAIFAKAGIVINKFDYNGLVFQTIDNKKYIEFRVNDEHLFNFQKGKKNYAKSLDEAEENFINHTNRKFNTNAEEFNLCKELISKCVEYFAVL